jgi:hypothetical protein
VIRHPSFLSFMVGKDVKTMDLIPALVNVFFFFFFFFFFFYFLKFFFLVNVLGGPITTAIGCVGITRCRLCN